MTKKEVFFGVIGIVIAVAIFIAGRNAASVTNTTTYLPTGGAVGDTQSTPKMAQLEVNAVSATYDTGSNSYPWGQICNNDARDRVVNSVDYFFAGLGTNSSTTIAALNVKMATGTSAVSTTSNTNFILATNIATSSPGIVYTSSSTPGTLGTNANRIWASGSCIDVQANGTTSQPVIIKIPYLAE